MIEKHIHRADLVGKTIDIHSHAGIQIREAAQISFPYCASVEDLAYRQKANGVDAAVVFPTGPDLFFDLQLLIETGRKEPAASPISRAPYERENRLLLTDVFNFCPEHSARFLPFISVDPGRLVRQQMAILRELEEEFPIYGVKIAPVSTQTRVTALLDEGEAFFEFFAARDWPILFHVAVSQGEEYSQAADTLDVIERHPELRYCLAHCIGFHRELAGAGRRAAQCLGGHLCAQDPGGAGVPRQPTDGAAAGPHRVRLLEPPRGHAGPGRTFPRDDHLGHRFTLPQLHHAALARGRGLRRVPAEGHLRAGGGRAWPRSRRRSRRRITPTRWRSCSVNDREASFRKEQHFI